MAQIQFDKRFTMGNVITVLVLVVSILYYAFGIQAQTDANTKQIISLDTEVVKLKETVNENQVAYKELVGNQRSILKLNRLIAKKLGIEYVIDVDE